MSNFREGNNSRWQFDLSQEQISELENLMETIGVKTKKDLFNNALTMLEWAVEQIQDRRKIVSLDCENGQYIELLMPIFSNIKKKTRVRD